MGQFDDVIRFIRPDWKPQDSIPPLDGPLTPNEELDAARVLVELHGLVDACTLGNDSLILAAGTELFVSDATGVTRTLATFPQEITVCAAMGSDQVIVGLRGGGLWRISSDGQKREPLLSETASGAIEDPTAVSVSSDGSILIADGSMDHPTDWTRDLLSRGSSGRLIWFNSHTGESRELAVGLRYASGVAWGQGERHCFVSEAWAHKIWRYELSEFGEVVSRHEVIKKLPAYPGRLVSRSRGGFWLAAFALRTQLVEFILQEDKYRNEMMRTVDPRYWVRPALETLNSGLEPLQAGQMKKLGITKPWAPPRSYGLALQLSETGHVVRGWHSRAGGRRHGITGVVDRPSGLLAVSAGSGTLLELGE